MDVKKRVAASLVLFYTIIVICNLSLGNLTSSNVLSCALLSIAMSLIGGLLGEQAEHHEFQQASSNNFNEDVNFGSDINPANGLAMIGGVDLLGNPYGADSSFICIESDIFNYSHDQP